MPDQCFFLIYRVKVGSHPNLESPTGGVVMEAENVVEGHPVVDLSLAEAVTRERWHYAPYEWCLVWQVFEPKDKCLAAKMHNTYEKEMLDWLEWMDSTVS